MKVKTNEVREWIKTLSFNEMCNVCKVVFGHRNFYAMTDKDWKDYFIKNQKQK
jgi:hypothetical protein